MCVWSGGGGRWFYLDIAPTVFSQNIFFENIFFQQIS